MTGINSAQRVASFLRPTNKYTVGESSIDHMIRFVLPIRLLPVIVSVFDGIVCE